MPDDDQNQERYDDILKRIANRKPFQSSQSDQKKPKSSYDMILDYVNAFDTLSRIPMKKYDSILCYGPQVIRKVSWSGVVVWYRQKGYHGYRTLYVLGVWSHTIDTDIILTIGIRALPYKQEIYTAEGYHASIRKEFQIFYEDDGHPPTEQDTILFQQVYEQKERLTLRQTLEATLKQWQSDIDQNSSSS